MKNVIIIEDEHYNRTILEGFINKLRPSYKIIKMLDKVSSSVEYLKANNDIDLIFMDIQLIDGVCFSIFDSVEIDIPIIFTTAYDEYAIKAFEVNSVDYLLKPLDIQKLEQAINKFEHVFDVENIHHSVNYEELSRCIMGGSSNYRQRLLVVDSYGFEKIDVDNVAYINYEDGICEAFLFDGTRHLLNHTLEKLEQQLSPHIFFRANRQVIVNINSIKRFESYFGGKLSVKLTSPFEDKAVVISRLKASGFKMWIDK